MHAYANPTGSRSKKNLKGRADGWGLIRFHKEQKDVTFECWPRFSDLTQPAPQQFPGWPKTISLD